MYRVMIVDDEPVIRKGLVNFIDWNSLDCEIIYEAKDGIDAKEQCSSIKPDIVITDIKMPGMDGIELSRYIYEHFNWIKTIILTGYADFEYARSAIKYNAIDFILKPTSTDKILEAVSKAKNLISYEKEKDNKIRNLEGKMSEDLQQIQEKFLHEIIYGIITDNSTILEKATMLNISLEYYYTLIFEIDDNHLAHEESARDPERYIPTLKNIVSLAFKNYKLYNVTVKNNTLCTIISFAQNNHAECMQTIFSTCEEIIGMVESFMPYTAFIGISHIHLNPSEIFYAYKEAEKALTLKFYDDTKVALHMPNTTSINHIENSFAQKFIDPIIDYIRCGSNKDALCLLAQMFNVLRIKKHSIEDIKDISILLCSLCSKLLGNHNINLSDISSGNINIYSSILECKSIHTLQDMVSDLINSASECLSSSERQSNYIIDKVKVYINNNYSKNIRLHDIAEFVHVNSSYLSRLFKKESGETITEAITTVRMEKAKELLQQNNDLKTYEIAAMVGIEDPAYFSQLFKKYTGYNPKDYKRKYYN